MVARGDAEKSIWIDELGWSTCDDTASACWDSGFTEAQQADHTYQTFVELERYPWVTAALQYSFRNTYFRNDDPADWNANLGLLRTDFSKKPAFAAFKSYANAPAEAPSDEAPSVRLTAPVAGLVFDRSLALSAEASDDKAVSKVEFLVDDKVVATDTSAPYERSYLAPKRLAYASHQVTARAYDAAGQVAIDRVSVTRSRNSQLSFSLTGSTVRVSLLPGELAAVGQVRGVGSGPVKVALQRYLGATKRWATVLQSRASVDGEGRFAEPLGLVVGATGDWRVRARYLGTEQHPESRARTHRLA